nr:hypothetical protein F9Z36_1121 [Neisseria gonorrhoeae]
MHQRSMCTSAETVAVEEIAHGSVGVAFAVLAVVAVADGCRVVEFAEIRIVFEREIIHFAVKFYEHLLRRVVWSQGVIVGMAFEFDDACFRADRIAQIGIAPTHVEFGDVAFGVQCVVDDLRLAVVVDVVVQISEAVFLIFRRHETEYQSLIEAAVFPIGVGPTAIFVAVCLGAIEVGYAVYLRPECLRGNGVVKAFAVKTAVCLQRTEGLVYVFGNKVIIAAVGAVELVSGK